MPRHAFVADAGICLRAKRYDVFLLSRDSDDYARVHAICCAITPYASAVLVRPTTPRRQMTPRRRSEDECYFTY